jgi:hypothetical protein
MRIQVATILVAILSTGAAAGAQSAPPDAAQPVPATAASDLLKAQTPLGGVEILTDTEGVDLKPFLEQWRRITEATWQHLKPMQLNAPHQQPGAVAIRFKVLPSGQLMDGGMVLEQRSEQTPLDKLDKAAWQTIATSAYPPLPQEFHGPYLELRAYFVVNRQPAR